MKSSSRCRLLYGNAHASIADRDRDLHLACRSGFEAFLLPGHHEDFRLRCELELEGSGKCGLVIRIDDDGNGYYLSLDLINGVAQMRAWGVNPTPEFEHAFRYDPLQEAYFRGSAKGPWNIEVIAHGMYVEVSIDGRVVLSLVDDGFPEGAVGFYVELAAVGVGDIVMETLSRPVTEHAPEMVYTTTHASSVAEMGPG